ncbi:hypothetical protein EV138_4945 [Kribbella voronezhensis]|uniref:Uncharacterized protein n=1 Tax=Kribbella voronezhensis TaxID=2512212 RepID=A0A4R7TGI1_9ACTN|nr:hypothetical protein EV138_4945 [Kribbella voronezhensis]
MAGLWAVGRRWVVAAWPAVVAALVVGSTLWLAVTPSTRNVELTAAAMGGTTLDQVRPSETGDVNPRLGAAVDAILARRGIAVKTGNVNMFLADVAPELRDEQRVLFQNLRAIGMAVTYRRAEPWIDRPALHRFGLATGTFRVSMRYQILGSRLTQAATDVGYTYTVRENRLWLVADDHLDDAIGSGRQPWDYGHIAVVKRKNILVIANQGEQVLAQNLATQTVQTAKAVRKLWKGHLQVVPLVIAMREPDVLTELPPMIPGDEPARIQPMPSPAANSQPVGGYVVIRPNALRSFDSVKETHALIHLLAVRLGDCTPRWLAEGIAQYAENVQLVAAGRGAEVAQARTEIDRRVLGDLTRLPADDQFSATDSYDISWIAVEHLIKQIGLRPVVEYYAQVARRGYNQFARERLMKEYTGFTEATLVESLRSLTG